MIICLPFSHRDRHLAVKLSEHIAELGGASDFDCLLVHEKNVSSDGVFQPLQKAFKSVTSFNPVGVPDADWSAGTGDARAANEMWIQTAWHMHGKVRQSWLWMEPDCVPLKPNWLAAIQEEYRNGRKRVMGMRVNPSSGRPRISGIAVYPPSVMECGQSAMLTERVPWDVAGGDDFLKHGHFTNLIYHVLRTSKEAPTFPSQNELNTIPSSAVLFHPCKDGSLIDRLREKRTGVEAPKSESIPTEVYLDRLKTPDPVAAENERLKKELEEFKAQLEKAKPPVKKVYKKKERTLEEQQKLNERMAKARAGRKKIGIK